MTLLERKTGSALVYAKFLETKGYTNSLIVQSFDWDFLAALKTWLPKVRLAAWCGEEVTLQRLSDLKRAGIPLAVWNHEKIHPESVHLFQEAGLEWWAYTVDEPKDWVRLVELRTDGIITNKPGELRDWFGSHNSLGSGII
jgi:glycerophosphoryl diester phosphodiesterase